MRPQPLPYTTCGRVLGSLFARVKKIPANQLRQKRRRCDGTNRQLSICTRVQVKAVHNRNHHRGIIKSSGIVDLCHWISEENERRRQAERRNEHVAHEVDEKPARLLFTEADEAQENVKHYHVGYTSGEKLNRAHHARVVVISIVNGWPHGQLKHRKPMLF